MLKTKFCACVFVYGECRLQQSRSQQKLFVTEIREPKTNDLLVALGEEMDANAYCSPGLGLVYKNNIAERRNAVKSRSEDDAIEWEIFLLAGTVSTSLS